MSNTFSIGGVTARYCREYFNEAYLNERSVEVALGRWFLNRFPAGTATPPDWPVMEVGCVMPYYGAQDHEIVDIADEHPRNRKANALTENLRGRNVLSISTIEHMQRSEYGNGSDEDSITFLRKVTTEARHWLVTWGVGYNPTLDAWVQANPQLTRTFLKRLNWKNEYAQVREDVFMHQGDDKPIAWSAPFGHSDRPIPAGFFNNANVVVVLTNVPELLS